MQHINVTTPVGVFRIRHYDPPQRVFQRPIDRLILHLAYHCVDGYCNPPGFAWAAFIQSPLDGLHSFNLLSGSSRLTEDELEFLAQVESVIIKVQTAKQVYVDYFFDDKTAVTQWSKLVESAQNK